MATMIPCYSPRRCGVTQHQVGTKAAQMCNPEDNDRFKHGSKRDGGTLKGGIGGVPSAVAPAQRAARPTDPVTRDMADSVHEVIQEDPVPISVAERLVMDEGFWDPKVPHSTDRFKETERMAISIESKWSQEELEDAEPDEIAEHLRSQGWDRSQPMLTRTGESPSDERIGEMANALMDDEEGRKVLEQLDTQMSPHTADRMERAVQDAATRLGYEDSAAWSNKAIVNLVDAGRISPSKPKMMKSGGGSKRA